MTRHIRKVAVLGSGVMGSAIAGHFANAGIPSLVLDIVPSEPNAAETARGLGMSDKVVRDRIARDSVQAMLKARPSPLFSTDRIRLVEIGNLKDDLPRLAEVDWVIEAVKEDMAIKKQVLAAVAPHIGPDAILTSNTSGLSLSEMAAVLPEPLRPRFLGTHFFNPPRYMKLLELISTPETSPEVLNAVSDIATRRLGKGIVPAKDTPNFIANRIGVHSLMLTLDVMNELGLSIEEVDALTGPALGRPKTATFRLADLVGVDVLLHVANNLGRGGEGGPSPFAAELLQRMVAKGLLGRKSGGGFYKKMKGEDRKVLTLDPATLEYRDPIKASFPEMEALKQIEDEGERLRKLVAAKGRAGAAAWKLVAGTLSYAATCLGEIADDVAAVDRAIRWGFNWSRGPFEVWDALGFRATTERLRADGYRLPSWVDALYASGATSLYREAAGTLESPTAKDGSFAAIPRDARTIDFEALRVSGREIRRNPGASLLDLGDGVFCLEFHSKMNSLGQDAIAMIATAVKEAETSARALVVANFGEHFSAGANLMQLLFEASEGNWDEIDLMVRAFQSATDRLERAAVPVVIAPHGLAIGGGCEVVLAGNAIRAAAESYIGLVEVGAGVVPAGGGCLRLYQRNVACLPDPNDLYPALRKTFETIGMAKVATSAEEAKQLGFLRPQDTWSMNRDHVVADAKDIALGLAAAGVERPVAESAIPVMGRAGIALIESVLYNFREGEQISDHDRKIGGFLARILSGGDVAGPTTVSAQHILDLERETFLRLCGERKTLERMQSLLKTGKPLRN